MVTSTPKQQDGAATLRGLSLQIGSEGVTSPTDRARVHGNESVIMTHYSNYYRT